MGLSMGSATSFFELCTIADYSQVAKCRMAYCYCSGGCVYTYFLTYRPYMRDPCLYTKVKLKLFNGFASALSVSWDKLYATIANMLCSLHLLLYGACADR